MPRQKIRLKKGQEIEVNGYVIRATGLNDRKPESLSVYHPNVFVWPEARRDMGTALYAGQADNIACASVLSIGLVGDLVRRGGWSGAVSTARQWLRDNRPYFHPDAKAPEVPNA